MNTKKKAPCTAATGKGAKALHITENCSRNWADGQEVFSRTTFRLFCDVRKKYIDDWNRLYDERNNEHSFFKILVVAYETGWKNGIRQERARRKRRSV